MEVSKETYLAELDEFALTHPKHFMQTGVDKDGKHFTNLYAYKDCGCGGSYHPSCGDYQFVKSLKCGSL